MAHVLMVAALQPHLSGAASKTVNLPNDATVEDVSGVYREAWRLGVKAIALYRDGSKLTQPLAAAKPKIAQTSGETDFLTDPKRRYSVVADTVFSRNEREALTPRARGYRQKFKLDGHSVYLHTGEYPDGRLAEIFTEMSKEGSTVRSLVNGFAKAISIGLQYGVPLDEFVDAFVHTKFEPAGIVEGHERIRLAQSLFDLIFRDVAIHYLGREELANVPAVEAAVGVEEIHRKISEFVESRPPVALAAWVNVARKAELDECPDCHNLSLVRTGTCRTCTRCSYNEGCG
jgi:ribonucleoside-diphosphate reductase alpha chain